MREVRWVSIKGHKPREAVERVLASAGVDPNEGKWVIGLGTYSWSGKFEVGDARWRVLRANDQAAGGLPTTLVGRAEYTEDEICAAELVFLQTTPELTSKGETGPEDGNEYDYSAACPDCLSGAKLIPPFRMSARDLPKRKPIAQTYMREYLVSGELAAALRAIPGAEGWLVPVEDKKSRQPLPWLAIQPGATMPRFHPSTKSFGHSTGRKPSDSCRRCGRDHWGGRTHHVDKEGVEIIDPMVLVYSRKEMTGACGDWIQAGESVPDAAGMWELFGVGTRPEISVERRVAQPYILVSQRVASVLRKHVGKYLDLLPVFFVD